MKWPLFAVGVIAFAVSAEAAEKAVKLVGVATGLEKDLAIIEVQVPPDAPVDLFLRAGQEQEGVEILKIEAEKGAVNLKVNGETRSLVLEQNDESISTNQVTSPPSIYLRSVPLQTAIELYANYKERTVIEHPGLRNSTCSLTLSPATNKTEVAAVFEKMLEERNIATIPDGEHFVMVVPFAFTNGVTPRSAPLVQTNSLIPTESVNFRNAPADLVLSAYADYANKEIVNLHDSNVIPHQATFTFTQTTPLSREEICYALETQIEWRNIRVVPDGNGKFKLERIPASK